MKIVDDFLEYEICDADKGRKYERWNDIYLLRPDPLILFENPNFETKKLDAVYLRSSSGGGKWKNFREIGTFQIHYQNFTFQLKQMGFKHTGLFPEQAINWKQMIKKIKEAKRPIKVLNLFAYTGAASVACLSAGASVVHVDSSKGMVEWAKENIKLNNLQEKPIRYIVDDVLKFVEREIRRGNFYDAIIMDPPSYGKGPKKEIWSLEKDLYHLVSRCQELLSDKPLFFLINSYSGLSPIAIENVLKMTNKTKNTQFESYEIGLPITKNQLILPCGVSAWVYYG